MAATRAAFEALTTEINVYNAQQQLPSKTVDEVAYGFVKVCWCGLVSYSAVVTACVYLCAWGAGG